MRLTSWSAAGARGVSEETQARFRLSVAPKVRPWQQRRHLLPIEIQFALRHGAVSQVEINKALVRNTNVFGDCLEVRDGIFVKTNRDLLFEL